MVVAADASALPLERANPSALPHDRELLEILRPLRFSVDARLKKNMEFWVSIYTQYGMHQGLIHDSKYIDLVYEIVELSPADLHRSPQKSKIVKEAKKKWKRLLLSVHRKQNQPESMTEEERKLFLLFKDVNEPNKFLNATHRKRLRLQQGQRESYLAGLKNSGRYLPLMEEIFRKEGLPVELTRLPFVESSFNVRASSKVGASGIWQFMRATGKSFLKINDAVDERNDPIRATEAAAKFLKMNYESLRQWPLAVTAYNHGRKGMMRAVRLVGSEELEDVVADYRSRSFGFASANFFCELLAAIEAEKHSERYFGKIERLPPLKFFEVKIPDYVDMRDLVEFLKLDINAVKELNAGLTDWVFSGVRLVPAGYRLRLPDDGSPKDAAARVFLAGYAEIPNIFKLRAQIRGNKPRVRQANASLKKE